MKKFTSLLALLCMVLSASAELYEPSPYDGGSCIFFEKVNTQFDHVYIFYNNQPVIAAWPGVALNPVYAGETGDGGWIYKWTTTETIPNGAQLIFNEHGDSSTQSGTQNYRNNGYYRDGGLNHTVNEGYTVYFQNDQNWSNVYLYAWDSNEASYRSGWPGNKMINLGNGLYKLHVNDDTFTNIIFNNGNNGGGSNQTVTITASNGTGYKFDGTYNNGNLNVTTFDAILTVTDGLDFSCANNFTAVEATYTRNTTSSWGTLCLPFAITNVTAYPDVTFYNINNVDATSMHFTPITSGGISAGTPVVFKSGTVGTLSISESIVPVTVTAGSSSADGWSLIGRFSATTVSDKYVIWQDAIHPSGTISVPAYRAYFEAPSNFQLSAPLRISIDDAEGLQFVEQEDGTVKAYYDLQGRKLGSARKGLVIENGKIIMVK